ncbi:hypothetical protein CaCOL14_006957 [Colletotrichum acutatum]
MALSNFTSYLNAGSTLLYVSFAFIIYYAVSSIIAYGRLRDFPGPLIGRFSYLWLIRNARSGRPAEHFTNLNRKHGSLVRIGPNDLVTDDPEILRRMNAARSTYGRSSWYDTTKLNPHEDSLFSLRDTGAHDKLKAKCAAGYAGKENLALEDGINSQVAGFVDLIRRKYVTIDDEVRPMDLGKTTQYFTLDVITRVAYGKEFGYLATDSDVHDYISTTEAAIPLLQLCSEVPWLANFMFSKPILGAVGPKHTDKSGLGKLMGVAKEVVGRRFGTDAKEEPDMLGAFIRHGVSQSECETEVLFQIIAGSDTTATAIRTTFLYLITSPRAYHTLKTEIITAVTQGRISSPITYEEGKAMPYLQVSPSNPAPDNRNFDLLTKARLSSMKVSGCARPSPAFAPKKYPSEETQLMDTLSPVVRASPRTYGARSVASTSLVKMRTSSGLNDGSKPMRRRRIRCRRLLNSRLDMDDGVARERMLRF